MVIYLNQPIKNGGVCLTSRVIIPSFATCEFHQARRHLPYDLDKAVYLEVQSNEEGLFWVVGYLIGSMGLSIFTYT